MDLKTARDLAGLSQTALAEQAGIKQQDISIFERGGRAPDFAQLVRLVKALRLAGLRGLTAADLEFVQGSASEVPDAAAVSSDDKWERR